MGNAARPRCCGARAEESVELEAKARRDAAPDEVPSVVTRLAAADRWGALKVRWGFGRDRYRVAPGLYAAGSPDDRSPVLVTANYRLSFDCLRAELGGLDAWILVLDTRGINVWCAAGKGTFGTAEIARRVALSGLHRRVSHRTLILPQLGAPGVSALKVKQQTGFNVVYGPIRARDIRPFLARGLKATPSMRTATFTFAERMAVVPTELLAALTYSLVFYSFVALGQIFAGGLTARGVMRAGLPFLGALLTGTIAVPALLPWIPFRSFALKGWLAGIFWALGISLIQDATPARLAGNLLLLPALSAYMALNFTGSTTFTSQSGVNREIRLYARPMAISGIVGILILVGRSVM